MTTTPARCVLMEARLRQRYRSRTRRLPDGRRVSADPGARSRSVPVPDQPAPLSSSLGTGPDDPPPGFAVDRICNRDLTAVHAVRSPSSEACLPHVLVAFPVVSVLVVTLSRIACLAVRRLMAPPTTRQRVLRVSGPSSTLFFGRLGGRSVLLACPDAVATSSASVCLAASAALLPALLRTWRPSQLLVVAAPGTSDGLSNDLSATSLHHVPTAVPGADGDHAALPDVLVSQPATATVLATAVLAGVHAWAQALQHPGSFAVRSADVPSCYDELLQRAVTAGCCGSAVIHTTCVDGEDDGDNEARYCTALTAANVAFRILAGVKRRPRSTSPVAVAARRSSSPASGASAATRTASRTSSPTTSVDLTVHRIPDVLLDRDEVVESIAAALFHHHHVCVTGLPGVGKTARAMCYAEMMRRTRKYDVILWLPAASAAAAADSCTGLGIDVSAGPWQGLAAHLATVTAAGLSYLLVLDACERDDLAALLVPARDPSCASLQHVLRTSCRVPADPQAVVVVEPPSPAACTALLANPFLVSLLGALPAALVAAASLSRVTAPTPASSAATTVEWVDCVIAAAGLSSAIDTLVGAAAADAPLARDLARTIALLGQPVSADVLSAFLPPAQARSPHSVSSAVQALLTHSLVTRCAGDERLVMHPVAAHVIRRACSVRSRVSPALVVRRAAAALQQRDATALRVACVAASLARSSAADAPRSLPRLLDLLRDAATLLLCTGRWDQAAGPADAAVEIAVAAGASPADTADAAVLSGCVSLRLGHYASAAAAAERVIAACMGPDSAASAVDAVTRADALDLLGQVQAARAQCRAARGSFRAAIAVLDSVYGKDSAAAAPVQAHAAAVLLSQGEYHVAARMLRQALDALPEDSSSLRVRVDIQLSLAQAEFHAGRADQAHQLAQRAYRSVCAAPASSDCLAAGVTRLALALLACDARRWCQAITDSAAAMKLLEPRLDPDSVLLARTRVCRARALCGQGQDAAAAALLPAPVAVLERELGSAHPTVKQAVRLLAQVSAAGPGAG